MYLRQHRSESTRPGVCRTICIKIQFTGPYISRYSLQGHINIYLYQDTVYRTIYICISDSSCHTCLSIFLWFSSTSYTNGIYMPCMTIPLPQFVSRYIAWEHRPEDTRPDVCRVIYICINLILSSYSLMGHLYKFLDTVCRVIQFCIKIQSQDHAYLYQDKVCRVLHICIKILFAESYISVSRYILQCRVIHFCIKIQFAGSI